MARITVFMTIPTEALDEAFPEGDQALEDTLRARLSEIYANDGGAVTAHVLGIDVEDDE